MHRPHAADFPDFPAFLRARLKYFGLSFPVVDEEEEQAAAMLIKAAEQDWLYYIESF